jgi:CubicO group peptidase (beta-lactamase class C family)
MNIKSQLLIGITNFVLFGYSIAQTSMEQKAIDSIFKVYNTGATPGTSVGVVRDGKVLFENGYGFADIEHQQKIDSVTLFWIASVSKQFTAAAIYLLVLDKKIDLKSSVRTYIQNLPEIYDAVSIDKLLHHTSGIRDGFVLTALSKKPEEEYTNENVLLYLTKQNELNFKPGTEFEYNNSGYVLLAKVIETVSNLPYPEFLKSNIFQPLGMINTFVSGKYEQSNKISKGYRSKDGSNQPGTFDISVFKGNTYGSTGIITNVADLTRWTALFHRSQSNTKLNLVSNEMQKAGKLNDGTSIAYAGGLELMKYKGSLAMEHFGADEGFKANILYFPKERLSIIGLANNTTDYDLSRKLYSVADIIINRHQPDLSAEPKPVWKQKESAQIKSDSGSMHTNLQNYAGEYSSDELETSYKVLFVNDGLVFELIPGFNIPMKRLNDNTFTFEYVGLNYIVFTQTGFKLSREGVRNLFFRSLSK